MGRLSSGYWKVTDARLSFARPTRCRVWNQMFRAKWRVVIQNPGIRVA
jgi:hypothetical protein